ncbi:MAG: hypothetical protein ACRDNH_02615 [Gaiellaceae bacterium]
MKEPLLERGTLDAQFVRAWTAALLAGGGVLLLLMAGFAAIGLLVLYILSGSE